MIHIFTSHGNSAGLLGCAAARDGAGSDGAEQPQQPAVRPVPSCPAFDGLDRFSIDSDHPIHQPTNPPRITPPQHPHNSNATVKQLPPTPGSAGATTRQVFQISGGAMELAVAQPTIQNVALLHRMALVQRRKLHEEVQMRQEAMGLTCGGGSGGLGAAVEGAAHAVGFSLGMTTPKPLSCGGEEEHGAGEADEPPAPFAAVARQPTIPAPAPVQKKLSWGPDALEGMAMAAEGRGAAAAPASELVLGGKAGAEEEEDDWVGFLDAPKPGTQPPHVTPPVAPPMSPPSISSRASSPSTSMSGSAKPPKPARPAALSFHPLPTTIKPAAPTPVPTPEFDEAGWPVFPAQRPRPPRHASMEEQLFSGSAHADGRSLSPLDGLLTPKDDATATPPPSQRASVGGGRRKHLSLELRPDDVQRALRSQQMSAVEVAAQRYAESPLDGTPKLGAIAEGGGGAGMGDVVLGGGEEDGLAPAIPISPGGGRGGGIGAGPADRWSIRSGRIDVDGLFKISSKVTNE